MQHEFEFEKETLFFEKETSFGDVSTWEHSEFNKGQIYTRPKVVEFMLNVIGLNTSNDLKNAQILEPSCGEGEFVVGIVKRLINLPKRRPSIKQLLGKLFAVELVSSKLEVAKKKVSILLTNKGYNSIEVTLLLDNWFQSGDFLLERVTRRFTHIIGNPPYIRVENIPKNLLCEYRRRFSTMTNRADLYIPFYEKSLSLLEEGGRLSFICTDRWTKNTYGKSLRQLISDHYHLELFIDLYGLDVFKKDVMTYPAITQILNGKCESTILKHGTNFSSKEASEIVSLIVGKTATSQTRRCIVSGSQPWMISPSEETELIRKIENKFPLLEDSGCKVFIGAATGSNKVYIVDFVQIGTEIEDTRALPVITASELKEGSILWRRKFLINTYDHNGLIDLDDYPKLSKYLNKHRDLLCNRHIAKKDQTKWFKTIDRVYEERAKMEKLLIPDISSEPIVLYDKGDYHPNNSIYYVCSSEWNLHALRVILLSNMTKLFISAYSTKIAKGYLRFQAQHLRKLRIPVWSKINDELKERLTFAGKENCVSQYTELACEVYNLNKKEKTIIGI